jgi:Mrp family chromosome partitioning ATPase
MLEALKQLERRTATAPTPNEETATAQRADHAAVQPTGSDEPAAQTEAPTDTADAQAELSAAKATEESPDDAGNRSTAPCEISPPEASLERLDTALAQLATIDVPSPCLTAIETACAPPSYEVAPLETDLSVLPPPLDRADVSGSLSTLEIDRGSTDRSSDASAAASTAPSATPEAAENTQATEAIQASEATAAPEPSTKKPDDDPAARDRSADSATATSSPIGVPQEAPPETQAEIDSDIQAAPHRRAAGAAGPVGDDGANTEPQAESEALGDDDDRLETRGPADDRAQTPPEPDADVAALAKRILDHAVPLEQALLLTVPAGPETQIAQLLGSLGAALWRRSGCEVLIVDGDMRMAALAEWFGVRADRGLPDWLLGTAELDPLICPTSWPGVHLLPSQPFVGVADEWAGRFDAVALANQLKERFAMVLCYVPSAAELARLPLAAACDGSYLLVRLGHTTEAETREAARLLRGCGAPLLGCVAIESRPAGEAAA